jgi:hypothetical protein
MVTVRSRYGHGTVTLRSRYGHGPSRYGHGTVTVRSHLTRPFSLSAGSPSTARAGTRGNQGRHRAGVHGVTAGGPLGRQPPGPAPPRDHPRRARPVRSLLATPLGCSLPTSLLHSSPAYLYTQLVPLSLRPLTAPSHACTCTCTTGPPPPPAEGPYPKRGPSSRIQSVTRAMAFRIRMY